MDYDAVRRLWRSQKRSFVPSSSIKSFPHSQETLQFIYKSFDKRYSGAVKLRISV